MPCIWLVGEEDLFWSGGVLECWSVGKSLIPGACLIPLLQYSMESELPLNIHWEHRLFARFRCLDGKPTDLFRQAAPLSPKWFELHENFD
jgi:hypothetical protein